MKHGWALALVLVLALGWVAGARADEPAPIPIERIHADPPLAGRLPRSPQVSPGGRFASWLQPSAADSEVLELWGQPLPSGAPRRLASAAEMMGGRAVEPTEAEKMALERRRMQGRGITDYAWCGRDDTRLIVPLAGDLWRVDVAGGTPARRLTDDEAEPERNPACDAAGRQLAFVKQGDLWVMSLEGGAPRRLTQRAADGVSVGLPEFIAAEEFGRFDGFWWSRDGRRLLALQVDERGVPIQTRMQIRVGGSELTRQHYPAAGQANAVVTPWVIEAADGTARELKLPEGSEYIARAGWFDDGTPWLQAFTRDQTRLRLVDYPPGRVEPRVIVEERDPAWVDVHDDLRELPGGALLWSSERTGRRQLWRVDRASGRQQQLTDLPEPVVGVVCAGPQGVVFAAEQLRGRAQALMRLDARGRVQPVDPGPPERRSTAKADLPCRQLLVTTSAWGVPPRLKALDLQAGSAVDIPMDPPDPLLARIVPQVRPLDLVSADGRTPLNTFWMPPLKATADPAGQAVIVVAYGGPGFHTVGWEWTRSVMLYAHWQRLGFGVLMVDTRGMAQRGRDFSRAHYRAFAQVEVDDLFAAVRQLPKAVPGVDPARIGFAGWSYGGFLALRALLDERTPFAAAVAGAPVVDYRLYDTAYTERYLGLPQGEGRRAYEQADLLPRARLLARPLMLVHGTADDNVLFENSLKMIQALQAEGKLFETVIYPGQTHGINGRVLRTHLDRSVTDFFVRHLRP